MPGQQLVQMPDGKLHVLNTSQTVAATNTQQQAASNTSTPSTGAATPTSQATPKIITQTVNAVKVATSTTPGKATSVKVIPNQVQQDSARQQQTPAQLQQVVQSGQRLKAAIVTPGTVGTPIAQTQKSTFVVANSGQVVQGAQVSFSTFIKFLLISFK